MTLDLSPDFMALLFPTKLNTVLSVFMVLRLPKDLESPKQVEWPTKDFLPFRLGQ